MVLLFQQKILITHMKTKNLIFLLATLVLINFVVADTQMITEYKAPDVKVVGNKIYVRVYLENPTNIDMPDYWLVELQVRPKGQFPLSFLEDLGLLPLYGIGQQSTCDPQHPENVHKEFLLTAHEKMSFELVSQVPRGTYDLYLISVTKCWNREPIGNVAVSPYYRGKKIGVVTITEIAPTTTTRIITPTTTTTIPSQPSQKATLNPILSLFAVGGLVLLYFLIKK